MGWADGYPPLDYTVNNSVGYPMLTGAGPAPVNHVLPAWDLLTGAYAAFALLAAIQRRGATGEGGEIRLPLSDIAIGSVANMGGIAEMLYTGENRPRLGNRSEEHTSELQSLMRHSYAGFCLQKKKTTT